MPKFTFKCEHSRYNHYTGNTEGIASTITHESEEDSLNNILENFEMFLRGCGFYFKGRLDIVDEETYELPNNDCTSEFVFEPEPDVNYVCPVCRIDTNIMRDHNCYDKNCPKGN